MRIRGTEVLVVIAIILISPLLIAGSVRAHLPLDEPPGQGEVSVASVVSPLLQYQGRLTDPSTGESVDDGTYEMSFRLYDVESGGSWLWRETKDVSVQDGVFSTALGDTTSLDQSLFDGRALWLGIKVGTDAEATPRQRFVPVAYALSLAPGAVISTTSGSPALEVNNTGAGDALQVGGAATVEGDLDVSGSLSGASHDHSGNDITTGTVAEPRIDAQIARDAEVTDAIDGHASDPDAHHVRYTDSEAWNAALDNDGPGSGLNADLLDGSEAGDFAPADHEHWGESWTGAGTGLSLSGGAVGVHSSGDDYGVHGESFGGYGVYGLSSDNRGVFGQSSLGTGVYGESDSGDGVLGVSPSGAGVHGESITGVGGYFTSTNTYGVRGETASTSSGEAGVLGVAGWTDFTYVEEAGVLGKSTDGTGVVGHSNTHVGVYGRSEEYQGVRGEAMGSSPGVFGGNWDSGYGVQGYSTDSYGGYFYSANGMALRAVGEAEVTGDLNVGGDVEADSVTYSSPRTHYFVVGGEDFVPWSNVDYSNSGGCGGAYRSSGTGALVAPVHLPHGAVVTRFEVFFYDTSSNDMHVTLYGQFLSSCGFFSLADVYSSGTSGYYSLTDTSIGSPTIDNMAYTYHVKAYADPWVGSSLRIKGAVVTYEISEAP